MGWMIMPLRRYFDFRGRSRRKEFWLWVLFVFLAIIVLSFVDTALGLGGRTAVGPGATPYGYSYGAGVTGGILTNIFGLAILIPNLAVSVRRLHDLDRSGWLILLPTGFYVLGFVLLGVGLASGAPGLGMFGGLFFIVGALAALVLLVVFCLPGTAGPNRFGPDPKADAAADLAKTFE